MTRIGIVGLGTMGLAITGRLRQHGITVSGYDVDTAAQEPFVARGGAWAGTLGELCAETDTVLVLVQSAAQVRAILSEIAQSMSGPVLCLIGATVQPSDVTDLAASAPPGLRLLDAPMAGAVQAAESGQLVFFIGGDAADHASITDVLDVIAAGAPLVGDLGTGQLVKAVNSLMLHAARAGVDEAMELLDAWAQHHRVDTDASTRAMTATTGDSWALRNRAFVQRYRGPKWTVKDLDIALHLADALGLEAPVATYLRDHFAADVGSVTARSR